MVPHGIGQFGSRQKISIVDVIPCHNLGHGYFSKLQGPVWIYSFLFLHLRQATRTHIAVSLCGGLEGGSRDNNWPLVEYIAGNNRFTIGAKHHCAGQPGVHQMKVHQAVVYIVESRSLEVNQVNFDTTGTEIVIE
ncbi:MAG: hypothetical protein AAF411_22330 [Myxococcota bacterium]